MQELGYATNGHKATSWLFIFPSPAPMSQHDICTPVFEDGGIGRFTSVLIDDLCQTLPWPDRHSGALPVFNHSRLSPSRLLDTLQSVHYICTVPLAVSVPPRHGLLGSLKSFRYFDKTVLDGESLRQGDHFELDLHTARTDMAVLLV